MTFPHDMTAQPLGDALNDECRRGCRTGQREASSQGTSRVRSNFIPKRYLPIRTGEELEEEFKLLRNLEEEIRLIVENDHLPTWIWGEYRWLLDRIIHKLYRPLPGGNH